MLFTFCYLNAGNLAEEGGREARVRSEREKITAFSNWTLDLKKKKVPIYMFLY